MLSLRWKFGALLAFLLAGSAWGQATYNCLPTCDPTDARFLVIANGAGLVTLSQPTLDLEIAVPKGTTTFTVGVFDGDAKGVDGAGIAHWDSSSAATFSYTLYADPNRDHAAAVVSPLSGSPSVLSTSMPDNAWIDFTVNSDPSAQAPSGNYFYLLRIKLTTPSAVTLNAFKVRTGGAIVGGSSLFPSPQPFSYIANIAGNADAAIVYPSFPSVTPTRYDGTFDFYFEQPVSQRDITVWDGDFDYGSFDGTTKDTDDPDTPNAPFLPAWATPDTVPEGVATGLTGSTGNPPDDRNPAGSGIYLWKPPSVRYDLIFPDGRSFANNDPSGNQEWEQFKISTDPFDRSQMDYHTDDLIPPGIFRLHLQGVDMQNLNALLLPGRALCVDQSGSPCVPLRPFLLGDTVFFDENQNGVQDPGEPGIPGVTLELHDANGVLIATTTTDADGHYSFGVEAESYTVVVVGGTGTAEGPSQCQATITNDNYLDCDFPYVQSNSIGDRVWNDYNGNGVQDPGEPGINGVPVGLYDSNNNLIASDTTNGDGNYLITGVPAGTYTVRVDDTYLPGGLTPTYDLDGVQTPNAAVVTVTGGQMRTDVDFGYQGNATIGDTVWNDVNSNGVQDPGEPGIPGVTVQLQDDSSNPLINAVTDANGHYSFSHLAEGTYNVQIDTSTLPAGSTETYDFDGTGTPDVVYSIFAEAGTTNNDIDFGYHTPVTATGSIGDRVWNDVNGDGVQDPSEAGLNGVTVQLLDGTNTVVATTTTSGDGNYTFSNLAAGTYTVKIVAASLPPGVAETYDLDGVGTANQATLTLNTAENRTDVDFGYQGTASVGDRVWIDTNGNGVQDPGEGGINGVQLQLLDGANNVLATTTTSGDGNYSFSRLNGGTYSVRVVTSSLPAGVTETYDFDGVITPDIATFPLNPGDSRTDIDFGYRGTASVGDRVWLDSNGNGTQDAGENGINGVMVQLLDASSNVIATATTTGDGNYTFSNLTAGNYSVRVTPPAGLVETYDLDGVATANVASFPLAAGQNRTDVDFGYRGTASVGDRVWLDSNGNGAQDAGEAGINGVTVQLLDSSNNVVATATTSGDGNYTFSNLTAGNYSVRVTPPAGYAETYDLDGIATANVASFSLGAGQNRTDVDFGYRGIASVGDRVWLDSNGNGIQDAGEAGINGVTVEILDSSNTVVGTATTSGDGNYTFSNLGAGTYTVRVSNLPAGVAETYDLDGVATANQATFSLAAGQNRTDVDFGYRYTGSVGDRVWLDSNGNGAQDAGEAGINGVTVQLLDGSNNVVGTATTAGDGNYTFNNLAPGTYTVKVSNLPAGVAETYDLDGVATANQATFSLAAGQNRTDVDFGYRYTGSVGDRVWLDANGNGVQDAGETGLNGVTVQLLDSSNNVVGTATTAGDGNYTFNNLAPGTYTVKVSGLPAGTAETFDLDGVATANQATFSLAAGQNRTDVDFGYRYTGSVGDRVWLDANGNGIQDAGETGLNGVTVQLLDSSNNVVGTATTSGDGNYTFNNLAPGTYTVKVSGLPAGTAETYDLDGVATANQATFSLAAGQNRTDVDFGYRYNGSVGDRVWLDSNGNGIQDAGETGLNGVTVQLLNSSNSVVGTATTAGDGNYTFNNLAPGTYTVKVSGLPAGVSETYDLDGVATANQATFSLAAGQNRTDVDFGYRYNGSVGDRVWLDANGNGIQDAGETGLNGVTVQLLDSSNNVVGTATTAGDGNYTFNNLAPGTYTVKVSGLPAGVSETYDLDGVATANQATFSLAAGQNRTDVDFGYRYNGSVGDRVWLDANGNGIQDAGETGLNGVTVQLLDSSNNVVGTATTAGDGNYTFNNLAPGTYTVKVSGLPAGVSETYDLDGVASANQATFSLAAGQNRTDVDFGYRYNGSVGDRVWLDANGNGIQDAGETGINGVTVQLLDSSNNVVGTATTAGDGNYTFNNLAPGTYTVRVSGLPAGVSETYDLDGVASANQATFPLAAGQNRTDVDFGYRYNGSVGDRVWLDSNGNGIQDAGETGLNGVTVQLLDSSNNVVGTATTAGDGNYTFNNLAPGTYTVRVSGLPAGVSETYDLDGVASANQATFSLAAGQNRTDVDFGYRPNGSVGDRVWFDGNGDGVQDAGEPGINGVTVQLLDAGNNVIGTTTTSGDGNYTFGGLAGGIYSVKIVASSLPPGVVETYDLDGVATANQATFTLAVGQNRTDVDFGYRTPPVTGEDCATAAPGDPAYDQFPSGHAFYMPGIGTDFIFTPAPGTFIAMSDGTATLQGTLRSVSNPNNAFIVAVQFSGYSATPPAGSPKLELLPNAYVQNGGPIDPSTWYYYTGFTGTLTGIGNYAGAVIDITRFMQAPQVGVGANGKNTHFGASGWFDLNVVSQPTTGPTLTPTDHGDIDIDLGDCPPATSSVGDRVWNDANGNGIQDAGETGINGATVRLLDAYGLLVATTTTSGDGNYTFNGLIAGTYTVQVDPATLPAGLAPSYDLDGTGTPNSATFALGANTNRTDVDFGYKGTASIGDRLWLDTNANGVQDAGEAGINGATVQLLDGASNVIATATTSGDGNYTFGNLSAGTYSVKVIAGSLPAGVSPSYDLDGIATPNIATLTVTAGQNRTDVDFGYKNNGSVGDRVWLDGNGNGIQDAGEAGINGVTVQLLDASANVVATTTTAGDGNYTFNNLAAGTYTVKVSGLPAGTAETYDLDGIATANMATFTLAAGANRTDVDFGYRNTGSVGDRVWLDTNANGAQDAGEAGINGVTVQLLDASANVVATTTTAGDGNYTFNNLASGTYTVKIVAATLPAGVAATYDLDGIATANMATFTLAAGANRTDVDFGYRNTGSVGDRVWLDTNANGLQDAGETGINGVTVQLLDSANNVVATTTTAGDGNYTFGNLAAGTYTVKIVAATLPAGVAATYDLDGIATANQATFTLAAGANRTDVDFGYRNSGSVGDRVWNDANGNGAQDAGEAGINGVTVQLLDSANNVVATTTTAGDGNYTFSNLGAGTYTVKIVAATLPAGVAPTYDLDGVATANTATFTLAAGASRTDVDFGYRATGSVGDRVWNDANGNGVQDAGETGYNGVTVQLLDSTSNVIATATTSGDGNYTFGNLGAGTYTVKIVAASLPAGVAETYDLDGVATANQATFALAGGQNRTDVDFGYRTPPPSGNNCALPSISDPALNNGPNGHALYLPGIGTDFVFVPSPGSFVTAADGTAHLTGTLRSISNPNNAFTIDVHFSGYTTVAGPGSPKEELNGSAYVQNGGPVDPSTWYYYTAYTGTLTGIGNYAGAVFSLMNTGPAFQVGAGANGKNANRGASGWFIWNAVSQPTVGSNLQSTGQGDINIDLPDCSTLATVGDRVWLDANGNGTQDAGETGINGVTVQLVDNSGTVRFAAITSGDGNYTFTDVPGSYSVRVVPSTLPAGLAPSYDLDGIATANVASFTLAAGQNRTDVDFGYKNGGSIGDRVWLDANGNGTQDAGETGINGVTVQLLNNANTVVATTTTSGDGNYTFGNLTAGTYTVKIVAASLPAGVTATYDLDGIATANQAAVTLAAGQVRTDVDFGYKNTGSVGDRVWLDANGNGTQDAGETGINGVTVQLVDSSNNVVGTATTSGDGNYTFSNLAAGTYTVKVSGLPAGTAATYDLDGIATANQATFTLTAGQNRTDVDFGYKNTGSVGDRVWLDANGNGTQDAGEAGINGATVQLLNSGGTVIATTTTSGDGNYTFSNLAAGTYTVKVSGLPAGTAATYDLDGIATANQATFTLTAGQSRTDVDFGYKNTGSVGDRVWLDANANGVQDTGETGINGVTVQLLNSGGTVIATTTTSGDGNYTFSNLAAGTYTVKVSGLPAGTAATYDLDGIATANQATFTLTAGQARTDVDFGYRNTASVGDRVWNDVNGNGAQDAGEAGINGVTVQLVNSANVVVATATTAGDGNYTFGNLAAGTYTVKIVTSTLPSGAVQTYDLDGLGTANQATFSLAAGQARTDVDFGYRTLGSVGDRVWLDSNGNGVQDAGEIGFNGLTVQLLNSGGTVIATTTTSGDGNYTFSNLAAGNYSVRVITLQGLMATYDLDGVATPNFATFTLAGGQNRTDVDFGVRVNGCAEGAPLDPTYGPTTGGQAFWFPGIVTDLVFTPDPGSFIVNADGTARLTGTLRSVSDPTKIFTVDVQFSGLTSTAPSGSPKKELQSSAYIENGGPINPATWLYFTSYTGTLTGAGTYAGAVITISRTGPAFQMGVGADGKNIGFGGSGWFLWTVTHQPTSGSSLQTTGQGDIDIDLDDCGTLGSVGNRVWLDANGNGVQDSGETGINGVTVQLLNSGGTAFASAITSGDGNYTFNGVPAGTYMVNIVTSTLPAGMAETYDLDGVATANKATFTLAAGASRTDVDFGYRGNLSIGDRVWTDTDGDGTQDSGEAGTNGVTVQLLNSAGTVIATTTTSGNGNYTFSNLTAGTYTVKVVTSSLPAGSAETFDLDGLSSANQATVSLTASRTDVDFGYRTVGTLSIGDRVWKDANANGLQDSTETGVNGVTVQLLNSAGTVIATTTTSGNGNYSFGGLFAGTYTVKIVTSTLGGTFTETYDLDGVSSANQATVNLTATRTDVDFGYHFPLASCGGTYTLGYWKNHASAWPVQSMVIGGVTYTQSQAITWLNASVGGDETISLYHQLVPAELNALIGNNVSCITSVIQAANTWMSQHPVGSSVSPSSSAGQAGVALETQLDDYNNGNLSCATHHP